MIDNDIRLDKEPFPGETPGEMFLRIEDKSAPRNPWSHGAKTGGNRMQAAMKVNLAWKREQLKIEKQLKASGLTMCQAANSMSQIENKFKSEESRKWPLLQQTKVAETSSQSQRISTLHGVS